MVAVGAVVLVAVAVSLASLLPTPTYEASALVLRPRLARTASPLSLPYSANFVEPEFYEVRLRA